MKKLLLFFFTFSYILQAQTPFEIWGATNNGGLGSGTIFHSTPSGGYQSIANFNPTSAIVPVSIVEHPNGKFYGQTNQGGAYGGGSLFEYDPVTGVYTDLKDYHDSTGFATTNQLFVASNGKIYGQAAFGYLPAHQGTIFEYDVVSRAFTVLHYFNSFPGDLYNGQPHLVEVGGKIYGIAEQGGASGNGGIFEIDLATSLYSIKQSFLSVGTSRLMDGQNGKLYGQSGVDILEYNYVANTYQVITPLNSAILTSGGNGFVLGNSSVLMGYSNSGGTFGYGYIYTYSILSNSYTIISDFPTLNNGTLELIHAGADRFYGITQGTGPSNGKIYKYDSITDAFTTLKVLNIYEGIMGSYGDIFLSANGNLYGTTESGGSFGGVIYKFDTVSNVYSKLFDFNERLQGKEPIMALTPMSNDKLIGRTHYGGAFDYGTIFTIDINTGVFTKKVDITGLAGGYGTPFTKTTPGKYYTCSVNGGVSGYGGVLLYDSLLNSYSLKQSFTGSTGYKPMGKMVYATDGLLYGSTFYGGTSSTGTLFRYDPIANTITTLFNFNSAVSGSYPVGELIQASNGKIYGITSSGGATNGGVLFEYNITTSTFTALHNLTTAEGYTAWSGITETSPGIFYGVTSLGGGYDDGTIFKYDATSNSFSLVYSFQSSVSGSKPQGSLMYKNGLLYGIAVEYGPSNYGTMFSFDPTNSNFTILHNMYPPTGFIGAGGSYCYECAQTYLTAVCPPLLINSSSISSSVCGGSNLIMSVTSSDTSVAYTWFKNGIALPGSDSAIYAITGVTSSDIGNYYCAISNGCRVVNSDTVPVNVIPNTLSVTASIANPIICQGELTLITASASAVGCSYSVNPSGNVGTPFLYPNSDSFVVTAIAPSGCIATDAVSLTVNSCAEVWPGDADVSGIVDMDDLLVIGVKYGSTGTSRVTQNNIWSAHPASLWTDSLLSGFNTTHVDCNGDGAVNFNDTVAISSNYGSIRSHFTNRTSGPGDISLVFQNTSYLPGDNVVADIYAGSAIAPLSNIYGLTFSVQCATAIIQPGTFHINLIDSWIGTVSSELLSMIKYQGGGVSVIGLTRKDQIEKNGYGKIGTISFVLQSIPANDTVLIFVSSAHSSDNSGTYTDLTTSGSSALCTSIQNFENDIITKVYPNPIKDNYITVECKEKMYSLKISDLAGKLVKDEKIDMLNLSTLNITDLDSGVYLIKIETLRGCVHKKVVISK